MGALERWSLERLDQATLLMRDRRVKVRKCRCVEARQSLAWNRRKDLTRVNGEKLDDSRHAAILQMDSGEPYGRDLNKMGKLLL